MIVVYDCYSCLSGTLLHIKVTMGGSLLVGRPPSARPAHQQTPEHSSSAFSIPHQKPPLHCRCGRLVGGPSVFFLPSLLLSPLLLRKSFPEKFSGFPFVLILSSGRQGAGGEVAVVTANRKSHDRTFLSSRVWR